MNYIEHNADRVYDEMRDADMDRAYQEWSETIEIESRRQQDEEMVIGEHYVMDWDEVRTLEREFYKVNPEDFQVIDLSGLSWKEIIAKLGG